MRLTDQFSLSLTIVFLSLLQSAMVAAEMLQAAQQTSPLVHGLKLSSVVPAKMTGDNRARELTGMDLAVKLHYLRGVYFFRAPDAPVGIDCLKEPMFRWLELCYPVTGRIRREDGGRPFVKCNDSGVRIVEAMSEKTVDEWLEMEDHAEIDDKVLVYDHALGPDLGFSPLVFVQFTWFRDGGISVGLSWAHVLGDAFSASSFLNMWGLTMAGHVLPKPLHVPGLRNPAGSPGSGSRKASSLRRVDPVGDCWIAANDRKMRTRSVQIAGDRLDLLMASHGKRCSTFHVLSAVIWKSLANIRGKGRVSVVTICTGNYQGEVDRCLPGNRMTVGTVEAGFPVPEASVSELATWMAERKVDESCQIEEMVGSGMGKSDYVLYGANVTFVNLEDANIYGLELKGQKPIYANYTIKGVGDEGTILMLPRPGNGMRVTMILPGTELPELEKELRTNWGFV